MANVVTFLVEDIRVSRPGAKAQASNPERVMNVSGTFYPITTDDKGKETKGEAQSATTKYITRDEMLSEAYSLDLETGRLTLPAGQRGRKAAAALSQDDIANLLDEIRNESADEDEDES